MFDEEYYQKLNKLAVAVGMASAFLSSKDEVPVALRETAKRNLNTAFDSLLNHHQNATI